MSCVTELQCVSCGRSYRPDQVAYTCPVCGDREGVLDVGCDLAAARATLTWKNLGRRPRTHWRYRELLPVENVPDWPVGWTPIVDAPRLAAEMGVRRLRLKDEGRNPTASFKDRASSVGVARALAAGIRTIACASTGNAASSLAGCAAMGGLNAVIFLPATAPQPKVVQLLAYGATVFRVQGTYAQAYDLCTQACAAFGWYNRNCAMNPYLLEGKKTAGLEIAEQCRDDPPDWVAVSVGDGCTIAGIAKGLRQMHELGLIDWQARLLGVQAAHVAPVSKTFHAQRFQPAQFTSTIADSIDVPLPRNLRKAVQAVRQTDGTYVDVTDQCILAALRQTGRLVGVFAEPAAAAAVAGVRKAVRKGAISSSASVLVVITGSGLKDPQSAMKAIGVPIDIAPDLDVVRRICQE